MNYWDRRHEAVMLVRERDMSVSRLGAHVSVLRS